MASKFLSQEDGQRLYCQMKAKEILGCNADCLDRPLFWFHQTSSGGDHRYPSSIVARYLSRFHNIMVDDDVFVADDATRPSLSEGHPVTIEYPDDREEITDPIGAKLR